MVGTVDTFIEGGPAFQNLAVVVAETEVYQLSEVGGKALVGVDYVVTASFAKPPFDVGERVALQQVVSGVESCLELIVGGVIIVFGRVPHQFLVEEVVARYQCHRCERYHENSLDFENIFTHKEYY